MRAGLALGSAGPSITMAACCEVLAFGLGALTPMPAVRNFSICAATAVALDFILQVIIDDGDGTRGFYGFFGSKTQSEQATSSDCACRLLQGLFVGFYTPAASLVDGVVLLGHI